LTNSYFYDILGNGFSTFILKKARLTLKPSTKLEPQVTVFKERQLEDDSVLIEVLKDSEYLWVTVSSEWLARLGKFEPFRLTSKRGMEVRIINYFGDKEGARQRKRELIKQFDPPWNGKLGRLAVEEKAKTGQIHKEKVMEHVALDTNLEAVLVKNKVVKPTRKGPRDVFEDILKDL